MATKTPKQATTVGAVLEIDEPKIFAVNVSNKVTALHFSNVFKVPIKGPFMAVANFAPLVVASDRDIYCLLDNEKNNGKVEIVGDDIPNIQDILAHYVQEENRREQEREQHDTSSFEKEKGEEINGEEFNNISLDSSSRCQFYCCHCYSSFSSSIMYETSFHILRKTYSRTTRLSIRKKHEKL